MTDTETCTHAWVIAEEPNPEDDLISNPRERGRVCMHCGVTPAQVRHKMNDLMMLFWAKARTFSNDLKVIELKAQATGSDQIHNWRTEMNCVQEEIRDLTVKLGKAVEL